nr:hypothetical protein [Mycoplasmopsis bovis]
MHLVEIAKLEKINFNAIANSYEDELDKLAYAELIKKTYREYGWFT